MSKKSLAERVLVEALSSPTPSQTLSPGPGPAQSTPKAALKRCRAAWQRAFDAYMDKPGNKASEFLASLEAGSAYCNAMPLLSGYEGIRDFIACLAHGVLIGAVPIEKSGQLGYAAQVALSSLQYAPKEAKTASK